MKRLLVLVCAAAATLFASAAEAARVSWSIGIAVPPVATYVSGGPLWAPAPLYAPAYAPAPIVYDEPYFVAPRVGFYGPPLLVAPRHRFWAPPHRSGWAPVPRARWDRHDRWHH